VRDSSCLLHDPLVGADGQLCVPLAHRWRHVSRCVLAHRGGVRILQLTVPFSKGEVDVDVTGAVMSLATRNVRRLGLTAALSALFPGVAAVQVRSLRPLAREALVPCSSGMGSAPHGPGLWSAFMFFPVPFACLQIDGDVLPVASIASGGAHYCRTTVHGHWAVCSGDFVYTERSVANSGPGAQVCAHRVIRVPGVARPGTVAPVRVCVLWVCMCVCVWGGGGGVGGRGL
jgi:hypothetical protein